MLLQSSTYTSVTWIIDWANLSRKHEEVASRTQYWLHTPEHTCENPGVSYLVIYTQSAEFHVKPNLRFSQYSIEPMKESSHSLHLK